MPAQTGGICMNDIPKLCLCCMSPLDEDGTCPECGNTEEVIQPSPYLPLKTVIGNSYIIGMEKKKNPEGITYACYDIERRASVSIREFYPDALAVRAQDNVTVLPFNNQRARYIGCMNSFLTLWRSLESLSNLPALITVYDIIEQNGTVYAVYNEPERISLRDYLLQTEKGYISWDEAKLLFTPVIETVIALNNAGVYHRGISPSSLIVGNDGRLKLTNFGIMQVRSENSVLRAELFEGYAAYEQYCSPEGQGPWTDVYALASSLYRTLTGVMPISALSREKEDLMMFPAMFTEIIPSNVIEGIIEAMEIYPQDRTQSAGQFLSKITGIAQPSAAVNPAPAQYPVRTPVQAPVQAPVRSPVQAPVQTPAPVSRQAAPAAPYAGRNVQNVPGKPAYVNKPAASGQIPAGNQYRPSAVPGKHLQTPPQHRVVTPSISPAPQKSTSDKRTVILIIILIAVLVALLAGIIITVSGMISMRSQIMPTLNFSDAYASAVGLISTSI